MLDVHFDDEEDENQQKGEISEDGGGGKRARKKKKRGDKRVPKEIREGKEPPAVPLTEEELEEQKAEKRVRRKRREVIKDVKKYRAVMRKLYGGIFNAFIAGCTLKETDDEFIVHPNVKNAETILSAVFGKPPGQAPAYSMRDWVRNEALGPDWLSFVWDSIRRAGWSFWTAKDAEFPKATREYLVHNMVRRLNSLMHVPMSFPLATAPIYMDSRSVYLKYRHSVGFVEFKLNKLDAYRWRTWCAVRDGKVRLGSLGLQERKGKFKLLISYYVPREQRALDPERVAQVVISEEDLCKAIQLKFTSVGKRKAEDDSLLQEQKGNGKEKEDKEEWSAAGAVFAVHRMKRQRDKIEMELAGCGSRSRKWGFRKAFDAIQKRRSLVTRARKEVTKNWNHVWSVRIVDACIQRGVGMIDLSRVPANAGPGDKKKKDEEEKEEEKEVRFFGNTWPWYGFKTNLKSKARHYGISVIDPEEDEEKRREAEEQEPPEEPQAQ